ncbi:MAG TPA: YihY/virulence factor BrkB family protein [Candidatus Methylomirabilis sp.]|nr:YihY/virulence factor BrkB family protein [Candidatus Methylomirabilis sp.]
MAPRMGWVRRVSGGIVRRLREHDLMMMAAAIAFYWLLAFIPLLLLGTSAIGYVLGSSDRAVDEVMAAARRVIPRATASDVAEFLRTLIKSRHVTGVLGIGLLLWVSMGVFEIIATSLTILSGGGETRSYLRRKLVAFVLMCTVGLLFLIALIGGWFLAAWPGIEELAGVHLPLPAFLTDADFPRYFTSVLMGILLTITYLVAPVRDIRWPAAIGGATAGALLWHMAKLLFNWYLTHYARYSLFYGILGGFIGLVLWIFYTAIILLFGGLVADILDRGGRPAKSQP